MNLAEKFQKLEKKNEKAFIGFVTAGDPSDEGSLQAVDSLIEAGADILELGLPFSDPVADGPVIQRSYERSLRHGMNPDRYFQLTSRVKKKYPDVPLVCLTYYNLILQRGLEKFATDCAENGVSGVIVPDLPVEESSAFLKECEKKEVDLIFMVAPTTPEERLRIILERASGFLYVVSLLGVTGARSNFSSQVGPTLGKIRDLNPEIPLAVGFGISKPAHVKSVIEEGADGAIVGSAFVQNLEGNLDEAVDEIHDLCRKLKEATR